MRTNIFTECSYISANWAQYVRIVAYMSTFFFLCPIRTNDSQRANDKQKMPQMIFWVYLDANKHFFPPKVDQVIQDSNEIFS